MTEKKKILVIADSPLVPSGVGTQTKYMIEALLGGPVKRPCRNRGVYSVFPNPNKSASLGPHVDGNHNEMMCVTLLRDFWFF